MPGLDNFVFSFLHPSFFFFNKRSCVSLHGHLSFGYYSIVVTSSDPLEYKAMQRVIEGAEFWLDRGCWFVIASFHFITVMLALRELNVIFVLSRFHALKIGTFCEYLPPFRYIRHLKYPGLPFLQQRLFHTTIARQYHSVRLRSQLEPSPVQRGIPHQAPKTFS